MKKFIFLFATIIGGLSTAFAGSCQNMVRLNGIDNILIDGDNVLIHSASVTPGHNFNLGGGYQNHDLSSGYHYRIDPNITSEAFKKYAMTLLLSAKASSHPVVIQVAPPSPAQNYVLEVTKISLGGQVALECQNFSLTYSP